MTVLHRILFLCCLLTLPLLAAEPYEQCLVNCPPGNNSCTQCCSSQFQAASQPCYQNCNAQQDVCFSAAMSACAGQGVGSSQYYACVSPLVAPCQNAVYQCQRVCDNTTQVAGGCPGEVPPQRCPYNCQSWNPASQSCIGPAMNMCPPPPPQACPYNCQSWNPTSQSCIGAAMNACGNASIAAPIAMATPAPAPEICFFDCQTWDPKLKTCVGSARNGCVIQVEMAKTAAAKAAEAVKQMIAKKKK